MRRLSVPTWPVEHGAVPLARIGHTQPVILAPPRTAQLAATVVWPAIVVLLGLASGAVLGMAVLFGGPATFLAIRGYRLSVEVTGGKVIVRGFLWSRTIPVDSVWMLTGYPALRWEDAKGRDHWTPLTALTTGPATPRYQQVRTEAQIRQLRRALGQRLWGPY
jgi:hypothetical protein